MLQGKRLHLESSLSHIPHLLLATGASETSRKQEQVTLQVMINYAEDQPSKLHPPAFPISLLLFLPREFSAGTVRKAARQEGRKAPGQRIPERCLCDGMTGTDKCTLHFLRHSWQQASRCCNHPPAPRPDPSGAGLLHNRGERGKTRKGRGRRVNWRCLKALKVCMWLRCPA